MSYYPNYQPQYGAPVTNPPAPIPGQPIGLPPGGSPGYGYGYGYAPPPPLPGQPMIGGYQPQYQPQYAPQYAPQYPPAGQSYYPPAQGSYIHPGSSVPVPGAGHSAPAFNATMYPGGMVPSPSAPAPINALWYLGTQVPNVFVTGATLVPGYDPLNDMNKIRNATKGLGTNDGVLITTLAPLSAMKMQALSDRYIASYGLKLVDVLDKETSFNFNYALRGLAMGPVGWDIWLLREAMRGIGTKESILTEILLGRSVADIRLLQDAYHHVTRRNLVEDVKSELSMKTERLFLMALSANRPPDTNPVDHAQVAKDVDALYHAGEAKFGTDEIVFCDIFINRSQPHLSAVIEAYPKKYKKYKSLGKVVKKEFSGHMQQALLFIYQGANPKHDRTGIYRDAKFIYKSMEGLGTRDYQLIWRVIRAHWDPLRFESVKAAYFQRRKTTVEYHVAKETSGSYKKLMVELTKAGGGVRP